jgi:hypothetical protein
MHSSALADFRRKYGFELDDVLDSTSVDYWKTNPEARRLVVEYRVKALEEVYEQLLPMFGEIAGAHPGFQIVVTAMDSYGDPELREYLGVDMNSVLALQKKYGFLLQVEDAERQWATLPSRYVDIGKRYARLIGDRSRLLLDLNIVSGPRKPDQVTLIQTGTESFQLVRAASIGAPRMTIYSESSVNPQDMKFFPFALASEVQYTRTGHGYEVTSPYSFTLKLPPEVKAIRIDGMLHSPSRENVFLIPAGTHSVEAGGDQRTAFSTHELDARILSINANLLSIVQGIRTMSFTYDGDTRVLVALNREATAVNLDGEQYPFSPLRGNDCFTLMLPPGKHSVSVVLGDVVSYGVSVTSFWSSNAIAVFGSTAVLLLLGMYIALKIFRRRYV